MKRKRIEKQEELLAKLRALEIKNKEKKMQARTGAAKLSSSYDKIRTQLQKSLNKYGYVRDLNKGMTFQNPDHLEAA